MRQSNLLALAGDAARQNGDNAVAQQRYTQAVALMSQLDLDRGGSSTHHGGECGIVLPALQWGQEGGDLRQPVVVMSAFLSMLLIGYKVLCVIALLLESEASSCPFNHTAYYVYACLCFF